MTIKLWHCQDSRSLRPLWALEELGLEYDVETLRFPPRVFHKDYLGLNPLGTVPFFVDGDTRMTESSGICHYLVETYEKYEFGLKPSHPEYGEYLNWLFHSDATLTFPQTLVLRYSMFEPDERKQPQVADDYRQWFMARLRMLDARMEDRTYLVADKFTIADITVGYALFLGEFLGLRDAYKPQTRAYLDRLKQRPAFNKVREGISKKMRGF